jgi:hypothetical protein
MHNLTELKQFIELKHKKKPTSFQGISLVYPNVSFSLASAFDENGVLHEVWTATRKNTVTSYTAKELKLDLSKLLKKV